MTYYICRIQQSYKSRRPCDHIVQTWGVIRAEMPLKEALVAALPPPMLDLEKSG